MSGWLMLACAKPDKNKKGNALGGAQPISSSAYSPVVRWLTHLVSEFYIRQKTRRNCSAIYGAAVKPRPNRLNFNNDNEAHAPENAKTMQRLLARWKIGAGAEHSPQRARVACRNCFQVTGGPELRTHVQCWFRPDA